MCPLLYDLQVPEGASPGKYKLRVEGSVGFTLPGGLFSNDTDLEFFPKRVSVFIQPSKFMCGKEDLSMLIVHINNDILYRL